MSTRRARPLLPLTQLPLTLLALGVAAAAHASDSDGVQLNAGLQWLHDSNLYRLSSGANAPLLIGKDSPAEDIAISNLGIGFSKRFSLQRIELSASLADYRYQNASNLNLTTRGASAAWFWSLTPRLHGVLSSQRSETVNSYADYRNFSQANRRSNNESAFNAEFEVSAAWRALGGATHTRQSNQQSLNASDDFSSDGVNAGLRYLWASGSHVTYRLKAANGNYLDRTLPSAGLYDDRYQQRDSEVQLHWLLDDKLSVDARLNHLSRSHPNYAQRDYSGLDADLSLDWRLTGKTGVVVGWTRQLDGYQTSTSNYRQSDRLSVAPVWQTGAKSQLRLRYALAHVDYLGAPTGPVLTPRNDTTRDLSLTFDWQPAPSVTLNIGLQNAQRSSNQPGLDYSSNGASLSAQYNY